MCAHVCYFALIGTDELVSGSPQHTTGVRVHGLSSLSQGFGWIWDSRMESRKAPHSNPKQGLGAGHSFVAVLSTSKMVPATPHLSTSKMRWFL